MRFPLWLGFVFVLHFVHVMHFISCHHVHRICIRVRLMHPNIFAVVRFAIRHSHVHRRTPLVSFREQVLNILGMDLYLPSGLGTPPVDRLSSFVPFGGRLVLQQLTELARNPFFCAAQHPSKVAQNPSKPPPSSRSFDHDRVGGEHGGGLDGLGGLCEEVLGCKEKGVSVNSVNRWSIKRTPNGTKLDRRSTGGVPRPHGKSRSIPRKFNTRTRKETKGGRQRT